MSIILIGNFHPTHYLGDMFSFILSAHANMHYWATVRVWLLVLCAGPLSHYVSSSSCITRCASLDKCWGGSTLRGIAGRFGQNNTCGLGTMCGTSYSILFDGKIYTGNKQLGFTLGGREGFYVPVRTLVGVKGGTGGKKHIGGVGNRCGAGSPYSYLSALFSFIMLPIVVSCSIVVSLRCFVGFPFGSCDSLPLATMTPSSDVT